MDLHARAGVDGRGYFRSGWNIAAHAVFGCEKRHEFHVGCFVEQVDSRPQLPVYACGVGDEAYTLAAQGLEARFGEHVDAGLYRRRRSRGRYGEQYGHKVINQSFHDFFPKFLST